MGISCGIVLSCRWRLNAQLWECLAELFLNEKFLCQNLYRKSEHIFYVQFFFPRKSCLYEIMWENIVKPVRPQMTTWRMHFACWVPKATNTHREYVILISFSLQQGLRERAIMLRYPYIACVAFSRHCTVHHFSSNSVDKGQGHSV